VAVGVGDLDLLFDDRDRGPADARKMGRAGREFLQGLIELEALVEGARVGAAQRMSDIEEDAMGDREGVLVAFVAIESTHHVEELDRQRCRANEHVAFAVDFDATRPRIEVGVRKIAADQFVSFFERGLKARRYSR
jgi:hypothetical protein